MRILFLGGAKRVSMAEHFLAHGKSEDGGVQIFSYELDREVPVSEVATVIPGLKWSDPALLAHLRTVTEAYGIEIIVPFVDQAITVAAEMRAVASLFAPVSCESVCRLFFSKVQTHAWCVEHGIPVPSTDLSEFPLIAKPDQGSASRGIVELRDRAELDAFVARHDAGRYLIQKFVFGNEYTVDAYRSCSGGNINYLVPRIRIETQGGESIKTRTTRHPRIEELSRLIIETSGLAGATTLQFLEDGITGEIYLMEVNPRFGGGVLAAIGAGVNVARIVIDDLRKRTTNEVTDWEVGLLMMRRFQEIYRHANHH